MFASNYGKFPSFSEEDVMLLRGEEEDQPQPLLSELMATPSPNRHVRS